MFKSLLITLLASLSLNVFAKDHNITATSWLVADGTGRVIDSVNANQTMSIASITKLMTAMVILDTNQDLNQRINDKTRLDLLQLMLIRSDNHASEILCQHYPTGRTGCVNAMNLKAKQLGLQNTRYIDPSGLGVMNTSTAEELVKVVLTASQYSEIVKASNTAHAKIETTSKKKKKHYFAFNNTNPLVATKDFIVSKTGYIRASGGCIVMMLDTKIGRRIVVLLNSKNTHTRIPEAEILANRY